MRDEKLALFWADQVLQLNSPASHMAVVRRGNARVAQLHVHVLIDPSMAWVRIAPVVARGRV